MATSLPLLCQHGEAPLPTHINQSLSINWSLFAKLSNKVVSTSRCLCADAGCTFLAAARRKTEHKHLMLAVHKVRDCFYKQNKETVLCVLTCIFITMDTHVVA